jgi:2-oxoglutarate ferredoxin oxidoreductase subunit alpha
MILTDGALGQMMEKVVLPPAGSLPKTKYDWTTVGKTSDRERNIITSLFIQPEKMEQININLQDKYKELQKEIRFEEFNTEDAKFCLLHSVYHQEFARKQLILQEKKGSGLAC